MPQAPEAKARQTIDRLLQDAGWAVQDRNQANISAARGVAIREFPLKSGQGEADYLLLVDGMALGVIEAKKEGSTLTGFEVQTEKYSVGVPDHLHVPRRPLPFLYQSTGIETRFTNLLEPDARSRLLFALHRPETLGEWLEDEIKRPGSMLRAKLRHMPLLAVDRLRPAQVTAIENLEKSLAENRPRALIQMASGGGKTYTACNFVYRLIKYAGARRVLFLVDRGNLGRQTLKEFQAFVTPEENRPFTELYNVQYMKSNKLDDVSRVCITTIQRLYSMLRGDEEFDPSLEEASSFTMAGLHKEAPPVGYNSKLPIEAFDVIVTDECHRSIYNLWRQVLEYFDAFLIGLTATPSKQTIGFFNQNLVMEYNHEQAVADHVNVDFDMYRIRTLISENGSTVNSGFVVDKRDRLTRRKRWEKLDADVTYAATQLDRDVVAPDQLRTIIRTFKERLFTEIFPGRTEVPKTLVFAKDDSHADDIVQIVREEFGKGNDFAEKITYRTGTARVVTKAVAADGTETEKIDWVNSGIKAEDLLSSFRNSYNPRVAVTVDMIATGTDIRPLEIVFFMRDVKSRNLFEQMKGRGARVVTETELQAVTPDARAKTHFVIVDAIGLCQEDMNDTVPLERKKGVSFEKLLEAVAFGTRDQDILSSVASRLARLDNQLSKEDRAVLAEVNGGKPLADVTRAIVQALDPDVQVEAARRETGTAEPSEQQVAQVAAKLLMEAAKPLAANPVLRQKILEVKKAYEQTIDTISKDELLFAGVDEGDKEKVRNLVQSFEKFIADNKDEITALQVLYSKPYRQRLTHDQAKQLAEAIRLGRDGQRFEPELVWHAYERLEAKRVKGSPARVLSDIIPLVRFAIHDQPELHPFGDDVNARFERWIEQQETTGRKFTAEQRPWLEAIRDHIAANVEMEMDDFEYVPFVQKGGLGRAYQVFGDGLQPLVNELNEVLAA
jgi:type I restriction enzyme, R subunit